MKVFNLALAVVLLLAAFNVAAKEKTALCHVGSEEGPTGELYDPSCVPGIDNNYFCPDAGKVDLIEVGNANAHLSNPGHHWDGISDYLPPAVPIGTGGEDTDGDYIDDACDDFYNPAVCECFAGIPYLEPWVFGSRELITLPGYCDDKGDDTVDGAVLNLFTFGDNGTTEIVGVNFVSYCGDDSEYDCDGGPAGRLTLTEAQYELCRQGPGWPGQGLFPN